MMTGGTVICASQILIIPQAGCSTTVHPMQNVLRKNTGQKQGVISNVRPDAERRMVVRGFKGRQHFKEILQPPRPSGNDTMPAFFARKFRQEFRHIVGDPPVIKPGAPQCMAHKDVKVKVGGDAQTPSVFKQSAEEHFIVKYQIPRFGVRQKGSQCRRIIPVPPQDAENEIHVRRRELDPAICLNHFHRLLDSNCYSIFAYEGDSCNWSFRRLFCIVISNKVQSP